MHLCARALTQSQRVAAFGATVTVRRSAFPVTAVSASESAITIAPPRVRRAWLFHLHLGTEHRVKRHSFSLKQIWRRCVNGKIGNLGWLCVVRCHTANNGQFVTPKMNEGNGDRLSFARDMKRLRKPLRLRGRWSPPRDGLYRVANSKKVLGGFLVQGRRVTRASPSVRRYIHVLAMRNAEWFCDPFAG